METDVAGPSRAAVCARAVILSANGGSGHAGSESRSRGFLREPAGLGAIEEGPDGPWSV